MQQPAGRGTPDFVLLSLTFMLTGFGILMVFSASSAIASIEPFNDPLYFTKRQILFAIAGFAGMFVLMNIPYLSLKKWFIPYFFAVVAALVFVLFRPPVNGARSWIGVGSFGIQPAEFAKIGVILYLAALITKKGDKIRDFRKGLIPVMAIVGFTTGLIMLQPDFGTALILVIIAASIIIAGGANLKHIFLLGGTAVASLSVTVLIYTMLTESAGYRMERFTAFLNPWADPLGSGYQIIHSLYAFGHGGLTGAGFGQSIQKLHYLPYAHTDFIFAIIGEEFGFVGTTIFILVYLTYLWRGLLIALRAADTFGTLIGIGVVSMIGFQALINIGGITNAIPLTGVPLPFISYGGSSLVSTLLATGLLLAISRENNRQNSRHSA